MQKPETSVEDTLLDQLLRVLSNLRYGTVEVTVHEGRIVQIERREKIRFDAHGNRIH